VATKQAGLDFATVAVGGVGGDPELVFDDGVGFDMTTGDGGDGLGATTGKSGISERSLTIIT